MKAEKEAEGRKKKIRYRKAKEEREGKDKG